MTEPVERLIKQNSEKYNQIVTIPHVIKVINVEETKNNSSSDKKPTSNVSPLSSNFKSGSSLFTTISKSEYIILKSNANIISKIKDLTKAEEMIFKKNKIKILKIF